MSGVMRLDWTKELKRDRPVAVLNDGHAALLGEAWKGAAIGARDVVMLTLGTGVGGAIMCDGRLLRGAIGRAGHLGHITIDVMGQRDIVNTPGSLENAVGECTLLERSDGRFSTTKQLLEARAAGDGFAQAVWAKSVRALAAGIVSIINAVDPEMVVIGGGVAAAGDALFGRLEKTLDDWEWRPNGQRVRIVPAALGDMAGALGAAWSAMEDQSERHPHPNPLPECRERGKEQSA